MNEDQFEGTAKIVGGAIQGTVGDVLGDAKQQAQGAGRKVSGSLQNSLGNIEEYAQSSLDYVKTGIYERPVQSTAIALIVGFLMGRLSGF